MAVEGGGAKGDADLVLSARAGDKDAFAVLVVRHQKMVLALVKRMLVNHPAMAVDVVQEAAVTALIALERLRSPERFGAWYAGIALNVARGWLRGNRAAFPLSVDLPDGARGPDELAEAAEMAEGVKRAVQGLPRGQRQAVLAFYWQGLSVPLRRVATVPCWRTGAGGRSARSGRTAAGPHR